MKVARAVRISAAAFADQGGHGRAGSPPVLAAARYGVPPFCVIVGGPRRPSTMPRILRFFDYRELFRLPP